MNICGRAVGRSCIRCFGLLHDIPLIAVNSAYHATARSYSLIFEYAHLLIRSALPFRSTHSIQEQQLIDHWCAKFTESFLIPRDALMTEVHKRNIAHVHPRPVTQEQDSASREMYMTSWRPVTSAAAVRLLARRFNVSGRAMAARLMENQLGTIDVFSHFAESSEPEDVDHPAIGHEDAVTHTARRLGESGPGQAPTIGNGVEASLDRLEASRLNLQDTTADVSQFGTELADAERLRRGEGRKQDRAGFPVPERWRGYFKNRRKHSPEQSKHSPERGGLLPEPGGLRLSLSEVWFHYH